MRFRSCDTCCVSWRFLCLNDCARLRSHPLSRTAYCLQWRATACAMQASASISTSASTPFLGIHVHTDPRTGASTSVSTHTTLLLFGRLVGHGTAKVWSNRRSSHHTPSSCRRLWRSPLRPPVCAGKAVRQVLGRVVASGAGPLEPPLLDAPAQAGRSASTRGDMIVKQCRRTQRLHRAPQSGMLGLSRYTCWG